MSTKKHAEDILKEVYNHKQKVLDREAAHSFQAYLSSLRILFGAFNLGDIKEETFIKILDVLKEHCKSSFDIEMYITESALFRKSIKKSRNTLSDAISRIGTKVLLIDDEYRSIGWDMVFNAVFGDDRVLYAENKEKAMNYLKYENIGLVFLDLKLSLEPTEGIELLHEIKMKRLDLPVVIFTGEDTIKYQRKCFSEGAFDYFVKEFKEGEKNYLDYYETFKDIVLNAMKFSRKGDIWRKIIKLEDDINNSGPPFFHDIIHYLKKAYYFLTIDEDNWLATMLLSKNGITHHAEVVIQCALSLEGLINKLFDDNKNDPKIKIVAKGLDAERLVYGEKLGGLKKIGILDHITEKVYEEINKMRKDCVHPKRRGLIISEEQATDTLRKTTEVMRQIIFSEHVLGLKYVNPISQRETKAESTEFKIKKLISNLIPGKFSEIKIEETDSIRVVIYTPTPAIVIGKKGSVIKKIHEKIEADFGKVKLDVKETRKEN